MNAQEQINPAPHQLAGIRPGTKRADVYDHLAGRTEATAAEIARAMGSSSCFSEVPACRKEVSDTLRHMLKDGLIQTDGLDPPRYRVAALPEIGEIQPAPPMAADAVGDIGQAMAHDGRAWRGDTAESADDLPVYVENDGITEKTVFEAPDGERFDCRADAEKHVRRLRLAGQVEVFLNEQSKIFEGIPPWRIRDVVIAWIAFIDLKF
jgi:hypothetical protein